MRATPAHQSCAWGHYWELQPSPDLSTQAVYQCAHCGERAICRTEAHHFTEGGTYYIQPFPAHGVLVLRKET